jgi:hypothetical protein
MRSNLLINVNPYLVADVADVAADGSVCSEPSSEILEGFAEESRQKR